MLTTAAAAAAVSLPARSDAQGQAGAAGAPQTGRFHAEVTARPVPGGLLDGTNQLHLDGRATLAPQRTAGGTALPVLTLADRGQRWSVQLAFGDPARPATGTYHVRNLVRGGSPTSVHPGEVIAVFQRAVQTRETTEGVGGHEEIPAESGDVVIEQGSPTEVRGQLRVIFANPTGEDRITVVGRFAAATSIGPAHGAAPR